MVDPTRRGALLAAGAVLTAAAAPAPGAWDFAFSSIEEGKLPLAQFRGRVLMVANTASFCGYTYQYEGLMKVHRTLGPKGLTVLGVPSQDFNQESADNAAIKTFCETNFDVDFPLAGLTHVRGAQAHPFYRWVKAEKGWEPSWNFNKVLIGRGGQILGCFGAADEPNGARMGRALTAALEAAA